MRYTVVAPPAVLQEEATLQLQEGFMAWHQQQGDADTDAHVSRLLANMTHDELRYSMSLVSVTDSLLQ